jgi:hypothetical protein
MYLKNKSKKVLACLCAPVLVVMLWFSNSYAKDAGTTSTAPVVVKIDAGAKAVVDTKPTAPKTPEIVGTPKAPAATPTVPAPEKTSLSKFSDALMDMLIPAFSTLILGLFSLLLLWGKKKLKLDVSDKGLASWTEVAKLAVDRGAEWSRNKVKKLVEGQKVPGPEVLDVAVNWATDLGVSMGLPAIGRAKLEGLIESELSKRRARLENDTETPTNKPTPLPPAV